MSVCARAPPNPSALSAEAEVSAAAIHTGPAIYVAMVVLGVVVACVYMCVHVYMNVYVYMCTCVVENDSHHEMRTATIMAAM